MGVTSIPGSAVIPGRGRQAGRMKSLHEREANIKSKCDVT